MSAPEPASTTPELWMIQPLRNAGLTVEQVKTLLLDRVAFELIIRGSDTAPLHAFAGMAGAQSPRVQKAWETVVWRYSRIESGEITEDNIPEPTLEEWLLEQIADEALVLEDRDEDPLLDLPGEWGRPRVGVELENKRQLIEHIHDAVTGATDGAVKAPLIRLLKILALPYADRAGYREEWRP